MLRIDGRFTGPARLLVYRQGQHRLRARDLADHRREQRAQQRKAGA